MHELLTPEEMARADRAAIAAGTPSIALMRAAGEAVAMAADDMVPNASRIVVLAGPGNNGGDGFVAAARLRARDHHLRVLLLGDRETIAGDALTALGEFDGPVDAATPEALASCKTDLVIDALFGAGLTRDVTGVAAALIEAVNAAPCPVLAVDLASGIDGRTGQIRGAAIEADRTVTFFRRKPGHLLFPGRAHCGETLTVDIGIPDGVLADIAPKAFANRPALWRRFYPFAAAIGHKYDRGHALVLSGGPAATGAARLSAGAALRAGAGLVTLASPKSALLVNAAHLTAVMLKPCDGADDLAGLLGDARINALVAGPGLGLTERAAGLVKAALAADAALVLDADALTLAAKDAGTSFAAIGARSGPVVLTPHEGEFKRLFPDLAADATLAKTDRASAAAKRSGAVIVLKGADTVVAAPDGRHAINDNAPPFLATAGAGDVLAGIVAAHLAQGMPAFEAAAAAVWLHGEAGTALGPGLTAEDLDAGLRRAIAHLYESEQDFP